METLFRYILAILISTVAGMQFVQVITRYVFEAPIMGLEEIAVIPTLWLYILGAVNASRDDTQIRANVLEVFLKTERSRHILLIISESISLVISSWLTYWAWDYFKYAVRVSKETPTLYLPTLIYESALFIGLLLMTFYVLLHLCKHIRRLFADDAGDDKLIDHEHPHMSELDEFELLVPKEDRNNG